MPNKRSAEKQARASLRRRAVNTKLKSRAKTAEKQARTAASSNQSMQEKNKVLAWLQSSLDKAAKRNAIHPNRASRVKSRVARLLKAQSK